MASKQDIEKSLKEFVQDVPTMKIAKRGKSKESFADVFNGFRRAAIDAAFSNDVSMTLAWKAGVVLFERKCYICEEEIYDANFNALSSDVQADHVVAPIHGGSGSAGNMLPAHRVCNDNKGDSHIEVFFKDRPETLKKIYEFQQLNSYKPATKDQVDTLIDSLEKVRFFFDEIVNDHQTSEKKAYRLNKNYKSNSEIFEDLKDLNSYAYEKAGIKSVTSRKKHQKAKKCSDLLKNQFADQPLALMTSEEFNYFAKDLLQKNEDHYWELSYIRTFLRVLLHHEALSNISEPCLRFLKFSTIKAKKRILTPSPKSLF